MNHIIWQAKHWNIALPDGNNCIVVGKVVMVVSSGATTDQNDISSRNII